MLSLLYQTAYTYLHKLHYKPNILSLTLLPITNLPASKTSTKMIFLSRAPYSIDNFIQIKSHMHTHTYTPIHKHTKAPHVISANLRKLLSYPETVFLLASQNIVFDTFEYKGRLKINNFPIKTIEQQKNY